MATQKYVDLTYLENMSGGSTEIIKEMVDIFIEQVPEFKEKMGKALQDKDWKALSESAHKAKSSMTILGIHELATRLNDLEINAKNGDNSEAYAQEVAFFDEICDKAVDELKQMF